MELTETEKELIYRHRASIANATTRKMKKIALVSLPVVIILALLVFLKVIPVVIGGILFVVVYLVTNYFNLRMHRRENVLIKEMKANGL